MILRELFARLGLDVDAQSFAKGAIAVEVVKAGLTKLVDTAVELAEQFVENVKGTAEFAEEVEGLGQSTGLGTQSLQKLGKAAAAEGIALDEFARSMILLSRTMVAAKNGGEEQSKAFHKAGVRITDAAGKLRPTEDIFIDLADGFSKMEDGAEKTALSMQLFGKSGAGMIQVLNNGRASLEGYMQAQVMTEEQIAAGKEMVMVQRQLAAQTKGLWRSAVAPLLPAITGLLKQYLAWRKANAEVMKQRIQQVLGAVIAVVKGLGVALRVVVGILNFFASNWKLVAALVAGAIGAWVLLNTGLIVSFLAAKAAAIASAAATAAAWVVAAAPFIALAALLAGILLVFEDIKVYQEGGRSLYGRFKSEIDEWLKPKANDPWWLAALKELVGYMQKALGLADELGLGKSKDPGAGVTHTPAGGYAVRNVITGKKLAVPDPILRPPGYYDNPANNYAQDPDKLKDPNSFESRYVRARNAGAGNFMASMAGYGYGKYKDVAARVPEAPTGPVGQGTVLAPSQTNEIHVYAAPGQSPEQIGDEIDRRIRQSWETNLEAAAAGGGG